MVVTNERRAGWGATAVACGVLGYMLGYVTAVALRAYVDGYARLQG